MYSMVLMAALTTGSSAPDCWFHNHGCTGGCYGSSCYGSTCCGGYGGCYGSGYGSCYGSYSYGCYGAYAYGGYGSCYGYSYGGGSGGCFGSASYSGYGGYSCHGCYGCGGCFGCYGAPGAPSGYSPYPPAAPIREMVPLPKKDGAPESMAPTRAKLIVDLPSDATLYIDNQKMQVSSAHRVFNTPELERGETYYYMLRAEVQREGKPVSVTRRVIVKPGQQISADFRDLAAPAVATAKLP